MSRSGRRILWIICGTAVSFAPALFFSFVSDDFTLIETARTSSIKTLFSSESWVYYRPLLLLSYAIEHTFWKASPAGYHATNVVLHVFNTVLVCILARRILGKQGASWIFAGILFGLTPVHASSVLWICGRTDLLCGTFYLISLLTFLFYLKKRRSLLQVVSIFSFIVALLCKEMAVSIPLLCFIWAIILFAKEDNFKNSLAKALKSSWIYFVGLTLYFIARYLLFGHLPKSPFQATPPLGDFLTNIGRYGVGLIFPLDLEVIKPFLRPHPNLLLVASLVGIGIFLVLLRFMHSRRPFVLASMWIGITLLPVLKFSGPWYLYIPSVGVALGLGYLSGTFVWEGNIAWIHRWLVVTILLGVHLLGLAQIEHNTMIASGMSEQVLSDLIQYVPASKKAILINSPAQYRGVPVFGEKGNLLRGLQLLGHPRQLQVLTSVRYAAPKEAIRIVFNRAERRITASLEGGHNFFQFDTDMIRFWVRPHPGDVYQTPDGAIEVADLNAMGRPSSVVLQPTWLEDTSIPVLAYSECQISFIK